MSLLILIIVIFAALSLVTVMSELSSRREQQQASAQEFAELLGLKEGQTIMALTVRPFLRRFRRNSAKPCIER